MLNRREHKSNKTGVSHMPAKSRQLLLRKPHPIAPIDAGRLAVENPDKLARNLLRSPSCFAKNRHPKVEIWPLLENLGSDAVVRRACDTIVHTRSSAELLAALNAAKNDAWNETAVAVAARFAAEVSHLHKRTPARDGVQRIEALCAAGASLKACFELPDLRKLLKHSSTRLRTAAAAYAIATKRSGLAAELLPIACSRIAAASTAGAPPRAEER